MIHLLQSSMLEKTYESYSIHSSCPCVQVPDEYFIEEIFLKVCQINHLFQMHPFFPPENIRKP